MKKRYSMATDASNLKNFAGTWNVTLHGTVVGRAVVRNKSVDVKTYQGVQRYVLEAHAGTILLTSKPMKKTCAFYHALFMGPGEIQWELAEHGCVKALPPLYWTRGPVQSGM